MAERVRVARAALAGALAAAAAALALGWTGCFFEPRTAQEGSDSTTSRWSPATSPDVLISNVRVTFEDRQVDFYRRGLRSDFVFRPAFQDSVEESTRRPGVYDGWGASVEEEVTRLIMEGADRIRIRLTEASPVVREVGIDTARIRKAYEFSIVSIESVGPDSVTVDSAFYKGILTFFMRDDGGEWGLYRWEDARSSDPNIKTWGKLRAETRP